MPDTFTHILIPALFRKYFKIPLMAPLVLIGTVIPDYLRELLIIFLPISWFSAVMVFHSLPGIILTSLFIGSFFHVEIRKDVFLSLLSGQLLHLLFDSLLLYQCGGPLYLFLPCWKSYSFAIIPETDWIYIFLFSILLGIFYVLLQLFRRYHKNMR